MRVPKLERELGIEVYASQYRGVGGRIRQFSEDFLVEEILVDGSKATASLIETRPVVGEGRFLICVLAKRDWDTILSVKEIAKRLGISHKRIQIAGIKDARALTAQHISIDSVATRRVQQVKIKDVTLHTLRFCDEPIFSRLLFGNQFDILIRSISHTSSTIEQRIKVIQSELSNLGGFPNFFGHQRFGTVRPITHMVGSFLVRGDLERAALTFLAQPSPHEHPESREARQQLLDTRDFQRATLCFPKHLRYERLMLSHLAKQPRDFVGAFRKLPRRLRKLFVQAYQSFLFNKFLSQRIRLGIPLNEAQIGDCVLHLDDHGLPTTQFKEVTAQSVQSIEEELKGGRMRIAVPLVGFKQPLSDGIQGEIEREILQNECVSPHDFQVSSMPEVSAPGRFRTILAPIINLSIEEASSDSADSSKRRVRLGFTLHRGSYATILLREFMKPKNLIDAGF